MASYIIYYIDTVVSVSVMAGASYDVKLNICHKRIYVLFEIYYKIIKRVKNMIFIYISYLNLIG